MDVSLEIGDDGWVCGWVLALPGCFWHAPGQTTALDLAPQAIAEYLGWLRRHGEAPPYAEQPLVVRAAEVQRVPKPLASGATGALFEAEREPLSEAGLERAMRLLGYSRADLLSQIGGIPQDAWDWSASDAEWPIRTHVHHLAQAELYYCLRLAPELPGAPNDDAGDPVQFLLGARCAAERFLRGLTAEQRAAIVVPHWRPGWWPEEPWTARKVLRRFIYHERAHIRDIAHLLEAWQRSGA